MKEGNSQEKALGMCYGIWNTHKKDKSKKENKNNDNIQKTKK